MKLRRKPENQMSKSRKIRRGVIASKAKKHSGKTSKIFKMLWKRQKEAVAN